MSESSSTKRPPATSVSPGTSGDRPAPIHHPPHYHPTTEERFVVSEGTLVVEVDGSTTRLTDGEERTIPPQTPHVSYTGAEDARFRREVSPPGQWREFLTERFAYAHVAGERAGVGGLLQAALWLRAYPDVLVLERPPRPVQTVLFSILGVVARATGRTAHHPYPRDASD
mgnify:CR=1 FL=1